MCSEPRAEVLDEFTMILRNSGGEPQRTTYPAIDILRAELNAFADTIENKAPFPVPEGEVLATLSAFEAALQSMKSGIPVACHDG
jgi:predicted dehydrogenase